MVRGLPVSAPFDPRTLQFVLRVTIVVVLITGIVLPDISVIVNASLALVVTALPELIRRDHDVHLPIGMTLWITGAVALHSVGMAVLYDSVAWWDHLTHLISGALVAGVGYATVRAVDEHSERIYLPSAFLGLYVLLFTLAAGVLWELVEMGGREVARALDMAPILKVYGVEDTILDLIFDGLGGLVVAIAGGAMFDETIESIRRRLRRDVS